MRYLFILFCLFGLLFSLSAIPESAVAADGTKLSLKTIKSGSSRAKAQSYQAKAQKQKPSAKQLKALEQKANAMRAELRRSGATSTPDQQWASYIAPLNRCTDLVRKTCGSGKQCAASGSCSLAVQFLELYNAESDSAAKYEFESQCIIALNDHTVFPNCE